MSRAYDEYLDNEAKKEWAMERKGYSKCDNCGEMFKASPVDPSVIICDYCEDYWKNKD